MMKNMIMNNFYNQKLFIIKHYIIHTIVKIKQNFKKKNIQKVVIENKYIFFKIFKILSYKND